MLPEPASRMLALRSARFQRAGSGGISAASFNRLNAEPLTYGFPPRAVHGTGAVRSLPDRPATASGRSAGCATSAWLHPQVSATSTAPCPDAAGGTFLASEYVNAPYEMTPWRYSLREFLFLACFQNDRRYGP